MSAGAVAEVGEPLTVAQYARREQISIQTAYRRLWEDKVPGAVYYTALRRYLIFLPKQTQEP